MLHHGRRAAAGNSAWTPLRLFASSEVGAWYDPSDFSTMWQDTSATTPVTATGQSVARIDDKSGNGKHLTQSSSGSRPLLQQDGSNYYYLDFDGTDDYMTCASSSIPLPDLSIWVACNEDVEVSNSGIIVLAPSSGNDYEVSDALTTNTGTDLHVFSFDGSTGISLVVRESGTLVTPLKVYVATKTATVAKVYSNKVEQASDNSFTAASATNSGALYMGCRYIGSSVSGPYLNGRVYGAIIRGASTSVAEIEDASDWLNGNCGAY